jgi:hypothetical protein
MPKIVAITNACRDCPNRQYESGGQYRCEAVKAPLIEGEQLPAWCPLPDHPATVAAQASKKADIARRQLLACLEYVQGDGATIAGAKDILGRAIHFC